MTDALISGSFPHFIVEGKITFKTVMALRRQGEKILQQSDTELLQFDLSQVDYADSSALALLFAWMRCAKKNNKTLSFENIPESMVHISRLCGVNKLL